MAMGFEFQTNWTVKKATNTGGHGPVVEINYPKETCLFGGRNSTCGYSMETDGGDVEFVIEPAVEESLLGRAKLIQIMDHMTAHIRRMETYNCEMRPSSHPQVFSLAPPQRVVIRPNGLRPTKAQPQITVGVRLGRINELVTEIARIGMLPVNPNALFDREGSGSQYFSRHYQRASQYASAAMPVAFNPALPPQPPSNKLKGLLTMTTQYLLGGAAAGARRHYAKDLAWAMSRTDFASMFNELKAHERSYFLQDPARWVNYALVTAGLHTNNNTNSEAVQFLLNAKVTDGGTLSVNDAQQIRITRGTWLYDMAKGINAIDRFTEDGSDGPGMRDAKGTHRLRAPGQLGDRFDPVGPTRVNGTRHKGVIIEFRQLRKDLPYTLWKSMALDVFDFVQQVNNRSHKAHDPAVQFTGTHVS